MKRRIILLMAILLISASVILVAAGPASISVDLASTEYNCLGQHDNDNESAVLDDYSRQLIEHIELPVSTDTSSSSNYTVTVSVDDFNYQFQLDGTTSKRPYQLDLVLCQQWGSNDPVYENVALNHDDGSSSHSFTIFASADVDAVIEEIHSGDFFEQVRKQVPFYAMMIRYNLRHPVWDWIVDLDEFIKYLYNDLNSRLTSAYLDIVLVLPKLSEAEKNQMLYANDNEYKSHIHVTGDVVQQEIEISGNYTSFIDVVSLNIVGNGNAESINLDPSESNPIAYGQDGIVVGTYSYEIKTSPGFDVAFDAFLSSSNNPSSNNGAFTLTCLNNDANETSITYEAGIRSSNKATKWFDGTQTFATLKKDDSLFNLGSSDFVTTGDYVGGGDIMFRLTNDSTQRIDEIPPGTYTSTIYFHVVADL